MSSAPQAFPITMQDKGDQWVVKTSARSMLCIRKDNPTHTNLVAAARQALDNGAWIRYRTSTAESNVVVELEAILPSKLPEDNALLDKPLFTREFLARLKPDPEIRITDNVRWIAKSHVIRYHKLWFYSMPSVYYLHDNHPRAEELLKIAWRSVNDGIKVRVLVYEGTSQFICDIQPIE